MLPDWTKMGWMGYAYMCMYIYKNIHFLYRNRFIKIQIITYVELFAIIPMLFDYACYKHMLYVLANRYIQI